MVTLYWCLVIADVCSTPSFNLTNTSVKLRFFFWNGDNLFQENYTKSKKKKLGESEGAPGHLN